MGLDHQIAFLLRESAQRDPERRAAALKGLGRIGRTGHARVLVEAAGDPAPSVRAAAASPWAGSVSRRPAQRSCPC
ncbi:HEAT repeat domain-containing protein [Streptomyces sp. NPDC013187]|uniref:HEAT repeat domain-containing protein n=1 Tax=Streptomyces sp. NPDC013187 TaxID=3364865 RepID=UPI0036C469F3